MQRPGCVIAFATLIALPLRVVGQSPNTLAGVVVREGTNQPLKHVLVTISYTKRRPLRLSYVTDSDGRFAFPNLPGGKWDLTAEKNGFQIESYQGGNEGFSTAVAVGAGMDTTHIVFPLHPSGIITGTVLDDQGDPVRQAQVMLFRTGVVYGRLTTQNVGGVQTDAAGEFSVGSLRPGIYYVAVSARPWYTKNFSSPLSTEERAPSEPVQHDERDVAYPITYYGDVTEGASAEPITVQGGNEARIQIKLNAVPAWRLTLDHGGEQRVMIETAGPGGLPVNIGVSITSSGQRIEILGVPGGRYNIRAIGPRTSVQKIMDVTGDQVIDFGEGTPTILTGRVRWEGSAVRPADQAFIALAAEDETSYVTARVQNDGSLRLDEYSELLPGRYRILLQGAPGYVVGAVEAKGARYANGILDIAGDKPIDLAITAASDLVEVDGIAMREAAPCPAAMILLLPTVGNPDAIRRDQSDSDGTFTLPDVLPGRYTLVAIDNGRELAYQDPAVMAKYLAQGRTVDVPMKRQERLGITVQQRQP